MWLCCCGDNSCLCSDLAQEWSDDFSAFSASDYSITLSNCSYSTATDELVVSGDTASSLWSCSFDRTFTRTSSTTSFDFCSSYDVVSWTNAVTSIRIDGPAFYFEALPDTSEFQYNSPAGSGTLSVTPSAPFNIGIKLEFDSAAETATYRYYIDQTEQSGITQVYSTSVYASNDYQIEHQGFDDDSDVTVDNYCVNYEES